MFCFDQLNQIISANSGGSEGTLQWESRPFTANSGHQLNGAKIY